jgi:hypothetical protein
MKGKRSSAIIWLETQFREIDTWIVIQVWGNNT